MKKLSIVLVAAFVVFKLLAIYGNHGSGSLAVEPTKMTPAVFAQQFNNAAEQFDSVNHINEYTLSRHKDIVLHKAALSNVARLILNENVTAAEIQSVMLIEVFQSLEDATYAAVDATIAAAAIKPNLDKEQLLEDIGRLVYDAYQSKPEIQTLMLDNVKCTASVGEAGMTFQIQL